MGNSYNNQTKGTAMSKQHGTALPSQVGQIIAAVVTAVCTVIEDFSVADLINTLSKQGEKLTQYLRLVFTALLTGQVVVLAKAQVAKILQSVSAVSLPAVSNFVAKDFFKVGDSQGVKIAYLGDNFKKHFLPKVEKNILACVMKVYKLITAALDPEIMIELGQDRVTSLAHLSELMKLQGNGQAGILSTNGSWNVFYIPDIDGNIWAVRVCWGGDGWRVYACSIGYPRRWDADDRVFGR